MAMAETMENLPKTMAETTTTTKTPTPTTDLWSRLPGDILKSIAKRLNSRAAAASSSSFSSNHINAIRLLRSVCKAWRCSVEKPSSSLISLLPLTLPHLNPNYGRSIGHFSLFHSTLYFLLQPPSSSSSTTTGGCCWLLRVQEPPSQNNNKNAGKIMYHPLNPLSKVGAEQVLKKEAFPESLNLLEVGICEIGKAHFLEFVDERKKKKQVAEEGCPKFKRKNMEECLADYQEAYSTYIKKVAVSESPDDYGVMAVHSGRLVFFKLGGGDQKWTFIDSSNDRYHDVVYREGKRKYYAVDYRGRTVVIDVKKKVVKVTASPLPGLGACQFTRLVESGGNLFLVDRYLDSGSKCVLSIGAVTTGMITEESHPPGMTNCFNVYKLDEENKQWEPVDDLNHQVFFLGDDCSFSVSALDFPGLKENCIFFSDCMFRALNEKEASIGKSCILTGVYNLKDCSCGPLSMFPEHWPIFSPPPAWLKSKHREGMMEWKEDQLQIDATTSKQDMPEPTPEGKKKAAEAKLRGDDAYKRKDYLVALDAYIQAIDFDPSDATLLSNRSVCWIRLGQAEHALTDAKACRALRPYWPKACYREGAALRLLQKFDEAANSFREGVELDPENKELVNAFREAVEAGKKFHGTNQ